MVATLGSNSLVILSIWRNVRLRNVTNYFILQLALVDTLVGLLMPFHMATFLVPQIVYNIHVCLLRYTTALYLQAASIACLLAVSCDRLMCVRWPHRYHARWGRMAFIGWTLFIWVAGFFVGFLPPFIWHRGVPGIVECDMVLVLTPEYMWFLVAGITTAAGLTAIIYVFIFRLARSSQVKATDKKRSGITAVSHSPHAQGTASEDNSAESASETNTGAQTPGVAPSSDAPPLRNIRSQSTMRKTRQACALVVGTFYVCWIPFILTLTVQLAIQQPCNKVLANLRTAASCLTFVNSAINPLVYALRMPGFNMELRRLLHLKPRLVEPKLVRVGTGLRGDNQQ